MTPQTQIVLKHLRAQGSITNVEANAVHGIRSVSRRITELREESGFNITKQQKRDPNGQRYVRYVLAPEHRVCDCSACKAADKAVA
ncbi:helix-turn-helix domain-containing protein [Variovorax sp. J22G73]|uniref:helix-turn-helix domain-containing protein n=1 Tax=unclassified Variovorax TaxID=663243 RepID=UPI002574FDF2|nr:MULTISPECIES: helix-turn-helix domain-containing protein [unclassified Variovorax]MDM0006467.1 helix-turn-helix domain-containing protein [Variovorax sp. J22R203]MDM0097509.1 helix-turn-helix domain-containing protein [Variovorax sp. J22G73]